MSAPGRPKGEYRSAQHEGTPVSRGLSAGPLPSRPALPSGEWPTYPSVEGLS